jgi:hypothetical protein
MGSLRCYVTSPSMHARVRVHQKLFTSRTRTRIQAGITKPANFKSRSAARSPIKYCPARRSWPSRLDLHPCRKRRKSCGGRPVVGEERGAGAHGGPENEGCDTSRPPTVARSALGTDQWSQAAPRARTCPSVHMVSASGAMPVTQSETQRDASIPTPSG